MDLLPVSGESFIGDTTSIESKFCQNEQRRDLFIIFVCLIVMDRLIRSDLYISAPEFNFGNDPDILVLCRDLHRRVLTRAVSTPGN
jgi:hypothetical protein